MATLRILIADDHPLMRSGVRYALASEKGVEVIGEAANAYDMLALCEEKRPDLLIMDINMPGPGFAERVAKVRESSNTKILVLSAFDDAVYARAMFEAGVNGYVLKDELAETLSAALHAVAAGGSFFSKRILDKVQGFNPQLDEAKKLTKRERDVLSRIANGADNPAIAAELSLAEQTVRNYVSRLYEKLALNSRVELALWARNNGLATKK